MTVFCCGLLWLPFLVLMRKFELFVPRWLENRRSSFGRNPFCPETGSGLRLSNQEGRMKDRTRASKHEGRLKVRRRAMGLRSLQLARVLIIRAPRFCTVSTVALWKLQGLLESGLS